MKELKYCCERFESDTKLPSTTAPNIRIVEFVPKEGWDTRKKYLNYFITLGYEKFDLAKIVIRHINYCPYCGTNLKSFYKTNNYSNEREEETFPLIYIS